MLIRSKGRLESVDGREIFTVDAVLDRDDPARAFWRFRAKQPRLLPGHEQAHVNARGDELLEGKQSFGFEPAQRRDRPRPALRVIGPLRRIEIDKVDDRSHPGKIEHILSHGR